MKKTTSRLLSVTALIGMHPFIAVLANAEIEQPKTTISQVVAAPAQIWTEGVGYAEYVITYSAEEGPAMFENLPAGVTPAFEEGYCDEIITANCTAKFIITGADMLGDIDQVGPELCNAGGCTQPVKAERFTVALTTEPGTLSISPSSTGIVVGGTTLTWTLTNTSAAQTLYQIAPDFGPIAEYIDIEEGMITVEKVACLDVLAAGADCTVTASIDARLENDVSKIYFAAANSYPAETEILIYKEGVLWATPVVIAEPGSFYDIILRNTSATTTLKKITFVGFEGDITGVEPISKVACSTLAPNGMCVFPVRGASGNAKGYGRAVFEYQQEVASPIKNPPPQKLTAQADVAVLNTAVWLDAPENFIIGKKGQTEAILQLTNTGNFDAVNFRIKALGKDVKVTTDCPKKTFKAGASCTAKVFLAHPHKPSGKAIATNYLEYSADNIATTRKSVLIDKAVNITIPSDSFTQEEFAIMNLTKDAAQVKVKLSPSVKEYIDIVYAEQNHTENQPIIIKPFQMAKVALLPDEPIKMLNSAAGTVEFEVKASGNNTESLVRQRFALDYRSTIAVTGDFDTALSLDSDKLSKVDAVQKVAVLHPVSGEWKRLPNFSVSGGVGNDLVILEHDGNLVLGGGQVNAGLQENTEFLTSWDGNVAKAPAGGAVLNAPVNTLYYQSANALHNKEDNTAWLGVGGYFAYIREFGGTLLQAERLAEIVFLDDEAPLGQLQPLADIPDSGVVKGYYQTTANAIALDHHGDVIIGGGFAEALEGAKQTVEVNNAAQVTHAGVYSSFGGGFNGNVNDVYAATGRTLFVGEFDTVRKNLDADELAAPYFAVWEEASAAFVDSLQFDDVVYGLESFSSANKADSPICVAGAFTEIMDVDGNVIEANGVALLDPQTMTVEPLGEGIAVDSAKSYIVKECICIGDTADTCVAVGAFPLERGGQMANIALFERDDAMRGWFTPRGGVLINVDPVNRLNTGVVNSVLPFAQVESEVLPQ